jgi:NADH-quinone oxidoreductase subunit I
VSNLLGKGLVEGLAVTAKNFVQSYFDGDKKEKLFTYQYPEEKMPLPENSRTFPFLVFDGTPEKMRCTACKICEVECPPQCIYIVMDKDEKGKPRQRPKVFDIDLSVCMQCGICVEVCPFESIKMDCDYEKSKYGRFEPLVARLTDLLKSNEYYHQIKPTEAAAVDAKLAEEAAKKAAKKAAVPAKPAVPAAAPKPATPSTPAAIPMKAPAELVNKVERAAWEKGYAEPLGAGNVVWPPPEPGAAPKPVASAAAPAPKIEQAPGTVVSNAGDEPWHDTGLSIEERLKLAANGTLVDKLMAAMGQSDCQACGFDCRGYAEALAKGEIKDTGLCGPGEVETKAMIEKLLKEAGKL